MAKHMLLRIALAAALMAALATDARSQSCDISAYNDYCGFASAPAPPDPCSCSEDIGPWGPITEIEPPNAFEDCASDLVEAYTSCYLNARIDACTRQLAAESTYNTYIGYCDFVYPPGPGREACYAAACANYQSDLYYSELEFQGDVAQCNADWKEDVSDLCCTFCEESHVATPRPRQRAGRPGIPFNGSAFVVVSN